jgi:hypothetical protein
MSGRAARLSDALKIKGRDADLPCSDVWVEITWCQIDRDKAYVCGTFVCGVVPFASGGGTSLGIRLKAASSADAGEM